jgi:hypothetical protein
VMLLGILQPINALYRPKPQPRTLLRKVLRWLFLVTVQPALPVSDDALLLV